ncbi:TIGR01212 family radical SAM protein [Massiliimalia timonensis]|uniref:TIGR01212 family radical SAM protein n=1 Tax=Massiliimalia timonensis TaxID=1987501 RepID=UPI000B8B21A4|nr:TIGR01212 family radical SAM protein [Massiliimalia timonensis]MBS7175941.1 TIGR01212 family radical SAM protein [Clostridiales bacterium]
MKSPFPYSDDNKRYHTWNYYLRHQFGGKVFKVSLNAGFTCPNLDGKKGVGGCTYCSSAGSGDFAGNPETPLHKQFDEIKHQLHQKWPQAQYIAYFQAHTNTYAPLPVLKRCFEEALAYPNVVGLSIATRADCLSPATADYLAQINQKTHLMVELGLQSVFDETGERINRCHSYQDFLKGYRLLTQRGIRVCVHLINGLPGETHEMMLYSARTVAALRPHSVKLHLLHVLKGTQIANELERGDFSLLSLEEYVQIICDQLEVFSPQTVIQRVTGDGKKEDLVGPLWSLKKFVVMNEIDKELLRRNSMQGKEWNNIGTDS